MPAIATIRKRARTRLRQLPTVAMDGLKFRVVVCADIMVLHGATPGMENCVSVGNVAGLGRGGNSVNVLGGWGGQTDSRRRAWRVAGLARALAEYLRYCHRRSTPAGMTAEIPRGPG